MKALRCEHVVQYKGVALTEGMLVGQLKRSLSRLEVRGDCTNKSNLKRQSPESGIKFRFKYSQNSHQNIHKIVTK